MRLRGDDGGSGAKLAWVVIGQRSGGGSVGKGPWLAHAYTFSCSCPGA